MAQDLLNRVKLEGNPVIDGNLVTFVWEGESAPLLIGDFNGWEGSKPAIMERISADTWVYSLELPSDAYIEYAFLDDFEPVADPFNPHLTSNGMGKFNHYFYMPQTRPTELARRKPGIPHGQVFTFEIETRWYYSTRKRKVHFYRPPVSEPCPLVVVWDGQDYLKRARLPEIVDNLIDQKRIHPVALAMVENGRRLRSLEYMCSEATILFLLDSLLPAANAHLNLVDIESHPGNFGVLGASAGGLMSLFTGLRLPHIFGKVLAQSGAYSLFGYDFDVWNLVQSIPPEALKIWLAAGQYEMLVECNRRMAGVLQEKGFEFKYNEFPAGHNYSAWQNDVVAGLEYLYGIE